MSKVLLLTGTQETAADILPSLSLLDHGVSVAPAAPAALPARTANPPDVVLVDARHHLVKAKELLGQLAAAGLSIPLLVVISEGAWAAITVEWGADDVLLHTAGPGEVEARIRLAVGRASARPRRRARRARGRGPVRRAGHRREHLLRARSAATRST